MTNRYKISSSKQAYDGKFLKVREDRVSLENGHSFHYEFVEHPGGAGILPVDKEGNCYLVRQYRYPVDQEVLEIPAGRLEEDGSTPAENAARECQEEVGFLPGKITSLGRILPSPGVVQEVIYLFLGTELTPTPPSPDPGEILETVVLPYNELLTKVENGEISDAKTAMAVIRARAQIETLLNQR